MRKIDIESYADDDADGTPVKNIDRKKRRLTQREKRVRLQSDLIEHAAKVPGELEQSFRPSFQPSRQERAWLLGYLESFYNDEIITDILGKVKGGKEATVYCCAAHPSTGLELIAAKVYRPAMFRSLRNDALYREGRQAVNEEGKATHGRREALAARKNTRFGQELRHTAWLEAEFQTMQLLYAAGANVPRPVAANDNVILMEYLGTQQSPAPTLNQVHLERSEAQAIFERLVRDLRIMLRCQRVHADLSAYNVLYWDGAFRIIDFPQAVDPDRNPAAASLFARDVERLCQYFARCGLTVDPRALASDLWSDFKNTPPTGRDFPH
jgi:RIO kinase 1